MTDTYTLYGTPHSLYTGKSRAYLRKQGVPFVEVAPGQAEFREKIVPAIGRGIIPVLVCPDGTLIQDTADILDHFEDRGAPVTARPPGARQRVLAHVIELYAVASLIRPAMHYRWSYLAEQEAFMLHAFAVGTTPAEAETRMGRMASYLPPLGVTQETIPLIEESFHRLLDILDAHFAEHPYLFGGQPSVGDYGLLGPLFAHLGRDPVPLGIMQRRAPNVFRWVERMNAPDPDMPDFPGRDAAYLPDDAVPDTLLPLLELAGEELFPELTDKLAALVAHGKATEARPGAPVFDRPNRRSIGMVRTAYRGVEIEVGNQPYLFYLWQRVSDAFDALDADGRAAVADVLAPAGLYALIDTDRPVTVRRADNQEVWGEVAL